VNNITIVTIIDHIDQLSQLLVVNTNLECTGYRDFSVKCYINGGYLASEIERSLDQKVLESIEILPFEVGISAILNKSLKDFSGEYFCYMPSTLYLENNWLSKMLFSFNEIEQLGIAIISNEKQGYHTHLLATTGTDLIECIVPFDGGESGCWLMNYSVINSIGAFNENLHSNFQFTDYCRRSYLKGYNVCFASSNGVQIETEICPAWFTSFNDYEKSKDFLPDFIPLGQISERMLGLIVLAENLLEELKSESKLLPNDPKIISNEKSDSFAISIKWMNTEKVLKVSAFAKQNDLNWNLIAKNNQVLIVFNNKNQ
jgi:hypothetical protein